MLKPHSGWIFVAILHVGASPAQAAAPPAPARPDITTRLSVDEVGKITPAALQEEAMRGTLPKVIRENGEHFTTNQVKDAVAAEAKASDCTEAAQFVGEVSGKFAGDVTLGVAEIVTAFGPWRSADRDPISSGIGLKVTAAAPVTSSELAEFGDVQFLGRDGALLTLYISDSPSPAWFKSSCDNVGKVLDELTKSKYRRSFKPDRWYLAGVPYPELSWYWTHAVGAKLVRTGLQDDAASGEDGNEVAAAGAAYMGLGLDGPISDYTKGAARGDEGTLDAEIYISGVATNEATLTKLYGVPVDDGIAYSAGLRFSLHMTNRLSVDVEYATPLDSAKEFMNDVAIFSISYKTDAAVPVATAN